MKGHNFPAEVVTMERLEEVCTAFIFASTAGYAALNYSQFDAYGVFYYSSIYFTV